MGLILSVAGNEYPLLKISMAMIFIRISFVSTGRLFVFYPPVDELWEGNISGRRILCVLSRVQA